MDEIDVVRTLNETDKKILTMLAEKSLTVSEIEAQTPLDKSSVLNSARKLFSKDVIKLATLSSVQYSLTDLGANYHRTGLPECILAKLLIKRSSITYKDLYSLSGLDEKEFSAAIGSLKKANAIEISSVISGNLDKLNHVIERAKLLDSVGKGESLKETPELSDMIKRGIIKVDTDLQQNLEITEFGRKILQHKEFNNLSVDKLNYDVIKNWKDFSFREYDLNAEVPQSVIGRKNIKVEFASLIKDVLVSMGFSEMHSNYAESTFWNFDVMMFKQNHPDRDIQDTVYIDAGRATVPKKILNNVMSVYESGFSDGKYNRSIGQRMDFDTKKSDVLILRGHTTSTTFRYIAHYIAKSPEKPFKFFSIDKVFRNETMDATHLLELYQIEGIVYDDNLTLRDLTAYIKEFYKRIGIDQIRLKPTYNPYTEPSLEIQGFSPDLGRWVELGNSGIFRPETLRPLGITKNIIAWGFGMERMLNLRIGLDDIRKLYGAFADLDLLRDVQVGKIFKGSP